MLTFRPYPRLRHLLVAVGLLCPSAAPAQADLFRRTDNNGVVHITNMPEGARWQRMYEEPKAREARAKSSRSRGASKLGSTAKRKRLFTPYIAEASLRYTIPEALIRAVISVESAWNPGAVSRAGAVGLMQLMPATAKEMAISDSRDPRQNILAGTRYLRLLANKFGGDLVLTLAAYNAGEGNVVKKMGVPYRATKGYVQAVLRQYRTIRAQGSAAQR